MDKLIKQIASLKAQLQAPPAPAPAGTPVRALAAAPEQPAPPRHAAKPRPKNALAANYRDFVLTPACATAPTATSAIWTATAPTGHHPSHCAPQPPRPAPAPRTLPKCAHRDPPPSSRGQQLPIHLPPRRPNRHPSRCRRTISPPRRSPLDASLPRAPPRQRSPPSALASSTPKTDGRRHTRWAALTLQAASGPRGRATPSSHSLRDRRPSHYPARLTPCSPRETSPNPHTLRRPPPSLPSALSAALWRPSPCACVFSA